jgi:hypothetical protein
MTFRSDDDAREERVRSLEKQLEDARQELNVARPKVTRLEIAEKENKRLLAELSRVSGGPQARTPSSVRTPLLILFALIGLLVAGLAGGVLLLRGGPVDDGGRDAYLMGREQAVAQREAQLQDREAELARREAEVARAVMAPTPPVTPVASPMPEPPIDPASLVDRSVDFAPIIRAARVVEVSGDAPVARRAHCRVTLTAEQGDCRAEVSCGEENLYPRTGSGGFFHCQVEEHVVHTGRDANPTPSSGDPRLELDGDARAITISDGPPDWSVRLTYDAH